VTAGVSGASPSTGTARAPGSTGAGTARRAAHPAASRAVELTGDLTRRARRRPVTTTAVLLGLAVVLDLVLMWQRRWMSDDGLIFLRTVRQIVAGNGPVFNVGERVETNTSTLWTVVLLGLAWLPVRLEYASVGAGMVLSAAALGLALDGARRLTGLGRVVVPAGGLVVLAMPPFWDFGTSGLETGLSFAWLAFTWWLLVRRSQREPRLFAPRGARRRPGPAWPTALVVGLGPLVRPDLALVSAAAGLALAVLEQPRDRRGWLRVVGLGGLCVAPALGYEVFRAGYYGLLLPSTALAKEAGVALWGRGYSYLRDTVATYWLLVAALLLLVAAAGVVGPRLARTDWWARRRGRRGETSEPAPTEPATAGTAVADPPDPAVRATRAWDRAGTAAVALAPVVGGLATSLYVVRVGGDFMHARMLLPSVFCLLLPVMALPVRRRTALPLVALLVWALAVGTHARIDYDGISASGIADERDFYVHLLGTPHPLTADDYRGHPYVAGGAKLIAQSPVPVLALQARGKGPAGPEWETVPLAPGQPSGMVFLNLGVAGALNPLDVRVTDTVGLAEPLAAHTIMVPDGRVGHDKNLPAAWSVARAGGVAPDDRAVEADDVAAAARALQCPAIRELEASVSAPLTWSRFRDNLVGAPARTALRFPRDPVLTEVACTPPAR
jgi:arabinofuranosyltransferase